MGEKNGKVSHLLEDGWFFGNTLLSCSNSSKSMIRCNSDPFSSSSSSSNMIINKEENLGSQQDYPSKMSNLFRTPSLPPCWGRDAKYRHKEEKEEEDDEMRMGDLIRQAMPLPLPKPTSNNNMPKKRLDRTPSLPTSQIREGNEKNGAGIGRLSRKESCVAQVSKLTRRASIDSSMLLPPKCNNTSSKGTKQNMSNSKNRPHPIPETPNSNNGQAKIDKSKSEKSLSELEVEELQGFKDLGFSFDNNNLSPSVKQVLPALQRRASLGSSKNNNNNNNNNNNQVDDSIIIGNNKVKRPYLSESWEKASYHSLSAPPHPTRRSVPSSDDMKAQIKFWARAVALNVHQEC